MARQARKPFPIIAILACLVLTACDENGNPLFGAPEGETSGEAAATTTGEPQVVEQDVERPDVFSASEAGLWDGRPSLGGVWVSYPDVPEPERVIVRNTSNGQSVIGALFRRERDVPGPRIQVSSDAAVELGMLAGQPVEVEVVALRREEIVTEPEPIVALEVSEETATDVAPVQVSEQSLDDPIAAAALAIEESEASGGDAPLAAPGIPTTAEETAVAAATTSSLEKPYVQIGIFSVEANANNTAARVQSVGVVPTVLRQSSQGKEFWRVIVGPSQTASERDDVLNKVKGLGYSDAYFVTN